MSPIATNDTPVVEINDNLKLQYKKERLIDTIHETSSLFGAKGKWGPGENDTGVHRLALSDEDKGVRDWFVAEAKELGCEIKIDELGNIFAVYGGKNDGDPTAIGSHLDTQPTGGRYDGILGVLSGLEVIRTLKDNGYVPNYPICVVNWTNEEGARFSKCTMASLVYAGKLPLESVYDMKSVTDSKPITVKQELERIGYLGQVPCSFTENKIAAHFEIHIEQGPILEERGKKIGIVQGVQTYRWTKITVHGKAQHTGTTPFASRSDALLASSKIVIKGNEIAVKYNSLCSVGIMELEPAVVNVIPQKVTFIVDMRHTENSVLDQMFSEFKKEVSSIIKSSGKNLRVDIEELVHQESVKFNRDCVDCVERAADIVVGSNKAIEMISGAGHDSCPISEMCPTTMIFIPSKDGVSHSFEEYSSPQEVEDGFKVMLTAVLLYDLKRGVKA